MKLWVEIPAFVAAAFAIHAALWLGLPRGGAPEGAGVGGAELMTLAGADGAVEAMVAAWDAPPSAVDAVVPTGTVPPSVMETPGPVGAAVSASDLRRQAQPAMPMPGAPEAAMPAPEPPQPPAPARAETRPDTPRAPENRPQARPSQLAEGEGGGAVRGRRAETAEASLSDTARRSLVASWGAEIRARIEARKVHPRGIRESGRPVVRITVTRSGALESVSVVKSSRIAALDDAAVEAVRRAGRFPAAPGQLDLTRVSFDLPISFTR